MSAAEDKTPTSRRVFSLIATPITFAASRLGFRTPSQQAVAGGSPAAAGEGVRGPDRLPAALLPAQASLTGSCTCRAAAGEASEAAAAPQPQQQQQNGVNAQEAAGAASGRPDAAEVRLNARME